MKIQIIANGTIDDSKVSNSTASLIREQIKKLSPDADVIVKFEDEEK